MLIFYRGIPWLITILSLVGFFLVMRFSSLLPGVFGIVLLLSIFLWAHLIDIPKNQFGFWSFLLTPILLLLSGMTFFLFLETPGAMYILMAAIGLTLLVYGEHLFYYFHQPSQYRVYTVERVSLVVYILTSFFLASALFGLLILVQVPLWLLAPVLFLVFTFIVYGTLWVSKVDPKRVFPFAVIGSVLMTQLFIALSFLPVAHTTNAALLTTCLYVFLGLSRADFIGRLTRSVFLRYLFFTLAVLVSILLTTRWV